MSVAGLVDERQRLEEVGDHHRGVEVVVHRVVARLADFLDFPGHVALPGGFEAREALPALHHAGVGLLGSLEGLVREVNRRAVVGLEEEEADCHRRVGLLEKLVLPGEELVEGYEVTLRLAHLLAVDCQHVVVHPVADAVVAVVGDALRDLALVVGELEVHAAAVDVELLAEVFLAHDGALEVPPGEAVAPG